MTIDVAGINWLAVLVGAAVYFVIGAAWFAPAVFGRPWMASIGWDESRPRPEMNPVSYAGPAIFYLIASAATALLAKATGTDTLQEGVVLGLVVGIGYALTVTATDAVFDPNKPKPWNSFAISGAYHLVSLVLVGMIIAAWH
jgi:Protein of unknown function (DUF1761)